MLRNEQSTPNVFSRRSREYRNANINESDTMYIRDIVQYSEEMPFCSRMWPHTYTYIFAKSLFDSFGLIDL